jgi:hypothetical protein
LINGVKHSCIFFIRLQGLFFPNYINGNCLFV